MFHLHHNSYPDLSWSSSGANVKLNISQHCKTLPVWFQATSLLHIGQTGFGWPRSVPSRLWPWMHVQSTRETELSHAGGIATSKFAGVICLSSVCSKSWGMGCSKVVGAWLLVSLKFSMYLQSHVRQGGECHFLNPPKKRGLRSCWASWSDYFSKSASRNSDNWTNYGNVTSKDKHPYKQMCVFCFSQLWGRPTCL